MFVKLATTTVFAYIVVIVVSEVYVGLHLAFPYLRFNVHSTADRSQPSLRALTHAPETVSEIGAIGLNSMHDFNVVDCLRAQKAVDDVKVVLRRRNPVSNLGLWRRFLRRFLERVSGA